MDTKTSPCGCRTVMPRSPGAELLTFLCPHHGVGPMALEVLQRLKESPHVLETLSSAAEGAGELPGSTIVRHILLVLLAAEEQQKYGGLSSVTAERLKNAQLFPAWLDVREVTT